MLNASIQFSSVMFDSLPPHGLQHARLPCSSPAPGACSDSCPSSQWCHPTIKFSVIPFSSCLQSFPVSGTFLMIQFFALGGQSVEASVLAVNIQDWFSLGLTHLISWQSKERARGFSIYWVGDKISGKGRPGDWFSGSHGWTRGCWCELNAEAQKVGSPASFKGRWWQVWTPRSEISGECSGWVCSFTLQEG